MSATSRADVADHGVVARAASPTLAEAQADAGVVQSLLNAHGAVMFTAPGDYYLGAAVVIPSGRVVWIGPGVRVIRHAQYASATSGSGALFRFNEGTRTENVWIGGGGTIARAEALAPDDQHTCRFVNYRDLTIENITFETGVGVAPGTGATGKYCVLFNNGEGTVCRGVRFRGASAYGGTKSDGLHFSGRHSWVKLLDISGTTGDNMIAFTQYDYPAYWDAAMVEGPITDVLVDGVSFTDSFEPFRIVGRAGPSGAYADGIRVRNLHGRLRENAFGMRATVDVGMYDLPIRNLEIENITITGGSPGYAVIDLGAWGLENAVVRGVNVPPTMTGVRVGQGMPGIGRLELSGVRNLRQSGSGANLIEVQSNVDTLVIRDCEMRSQTPAGSFAVLAPSMPGSAWITVRRLIASDNVAVGDGQASFLVLRSAGYGRVVDGVLTNTMTEGLVRVVSGPPSVGAAADTRSRFLFNNLTIHGDGAAKFIGQVDAVVSNWSRAGNGAFLWADTTVTGNPTVALNPEWVTVVLKASDFPSTGTGTSTLNLASLPRYGDRMRATRGGVCQAVKFRVIEPFAGGGVTSATLAAGSVVHPTRFASLVNAMTAGTTVRTPDDKWMTVVEPETLDEPLAVQVRLTGGVPSGLTAGTVEVSFLIGATISAGP